MSEALPSGALAPIEVRVDDLRSAEVQALIAEHLAGMRTHSPPGQVNALDREQLCAEGLCFWTAWVDGSVAGCGALKAVDEQSGEIKSMRTRPTFVRRGVAQAVLEQIVLEAKKRGYQRLLLETGTGPAFAAAHAFYLSNGFRWSHCFGGYQATEFNVFMAKDLL